MAAKKAQQAQEERYLTPSVRAGGENVGHLEERIAQRVRELARLALEAAAQAKADATPLAVPGMRPAPEPK